MRILMYECRTKLGHATMRQSLGMMTRNCKRNYKTSELLWVLLKPGRRKLQ